MIASRLDRTLSREAVEEEEEEEEEEEDDEITEVYNSGVVHNCDFSSVSNGKDNLASSSVDMACSFRTVSTQTGAAMFFL